MWWGEGEEEVGLGFRLGDLDTLGRVDVISNDALAGSDNSSQYGSTMDSARNRERGFVAVLRSSARLTSLGGQKML